jgi:hypothetical protein
MKQRFRLTAISCTGVLVGLTFLTLILTANKPVQATMVDSVSSVSVSITESGSDCHGGRAGGLDQPHAGDSALGRL